MGINFSAIFNILTSSPGSLVYHLVITFALALITGMAVVRLRQDGAEQEVRRGLIGCVVLLTTQIILLAIDLTLSPSIFNTSMTFALIERLTSALAVTWLFWTFINYKKQVLLTGVIISLSLAIIFLGTVSISISNLQQTAPPINNVALLRIWQGTTVLLSLIGLTLLLMNRPPQWGVAAAMFALFALGHLVQLFIIRSGSYQMGAARLGQYLSLPWMIALAQRFGKKNLATAGQTVQPIENAETLLDTKPTLVDLLLKIVLKESPKGKAKAIAHALSYSVVSDVCFLFQFVEDEDKIQLISGYDLILEEFLSPTMVDKSKMPRILEAWNNNKTLMLSQVYADSKDTATLAELLRYHRIGNLLAYPLSLPDQPVLGGVIFISPYTDKPWGQKTLSLLDEIRNTLTKVLFTHNPQESLREELAQLESKNEALILENNSLSQHIEEKESAITKKQESIQQLKAKYQIDKIKSVERIENLREKIREMAAQFTLQEDLSVQMEQMRDEIRQLISERDRLKSELAQAAARLKELEDRAGQTGPIRISMDTQVISLDSIAANVRLKLAHRLQKQNADLEIENPDGRQMIKTDPELVQAIIHGLLENALLASDHWSSIQLSQKLSFETGMLLIEVTDHGEGLSPAEQRAFFSADQENLPGIGSFQAIRDAIRAIRVLNGKIWLRSKKNEFTTFRVQLPVRIID